VFKELWYPKVLKRAIELASGVLSIHHIDYNYKHPWSAKLHPSSTPGHVHACVCEFMSLAKTNGSGMVSPYIRWPHGWRDVDRGWVTIRSNRCREEADSATPRSMAPQANVCRAMRSGVARPDAGSTRPTWQLCRAIIKSVTDTYAAPCSIAP
jgi:hypothetical protein